PRRLDHDVPPLGRDLHPCRGVVQRSPRSVRRGDGVRLVTVDHEITVDGVDATQVCVVLLFRDNGFRASGTFTDRLIYERGDWYFTSRELEWDLVPRENALPV